MKERPRRRQLSLLPGVPPACSPGGGMSALRLPGRFPLVAVAVAGGGVAEGSPEDPAEVGCVSESPPRRNGRTGPFCQDRIQEVAPAAFEPALPDGRGHGGADLLEKIVQVPGGDVVGGGYGSRGKLGVTQIGLDVVMDTAQQEEVGIAACLDELDTFPVEQGSDQDKCIMDQTEAIRS